MHSNRRRALCLALLVAMVLFVAGAAACICDVGVRREVAPAFAEIKMASEAAPTEAGAARTGVDIFRPMADSQGARLCSTELRTRSLNPCAFLETPGRCWSPTTWRPSGGGEVVASIETKLPR